jgi:FtsP/CotA-like multicopper oxidase with cupredoxin domain
MTTLVSVELDAREIEWEFARGRSVRGFGFTGGVPGPLIEANVGDTIRARLTNNLGQPTTIHWHGLRVPSDMDGTEAVQPPVGPGGTFQYQFVVPDAGTFWYHSHVNETEQLERGLYGALIVRGPDDPALDRDESFSWTISSSVPTAMWHRLATSTSCMRGARGKCGL